MMIEEFICKGILHQQKDVIARHLKEIQLDLRENHKKEELIVKDNHSTFFGDSGIWVRLRYDYRCRSWSLYRGDESKEPWRNWVGHAFLYYEDCDFDDLAYELVEKVIQNAIEEYQLEYS